RPTVAARGQGIGLSEVLKQFRLLLRRHADAGIHNGKLDPVASVGHLAYPKGDLALLRELAGIAQEIEQNLLEPHGIRGKRAQVLLGFDNEAVLVLRGELSRGADDLVDEPGQIDTLGIEFELAGFDLREVEDLVDEAQEVGPGGIDAAQRLQRLFRAEARRVGDHHLGETDDGVERRAQLVAHAGEELRLALARLRQLPALVLDFVEQPHVLDGDHRLVSKGRNQLDLLVSERTYDRSRQIEHPNRDPRAYQRSPQDGANASTALDRLGPGVFRVDADVGDMNSAPLKRRSPDQRV